MSNAAHSSSNPCIWSREEIDQWLGSLSADMQERMKNLGRQWLSEGRDLVLGFNIVRYMMEKGYFNQPSQNPMMGTSYGTPLGMPVASAWPGIFGVAQDLMLGKRGARIDRGLANFSDHQRRVERQNDRMYKLLERKLGA